MQNLDGRNFVERESYERKGVKIAHPAHADGAAE
jgi:hypothetical protein